MFNTFYFMHGLSIYEIDRSSYGTDPIVAPNTTDMPLSVS